MKGIGNVEYIRQGSEVLVQDGEATNWAFLYAASTEKDAKWNVGDRVVTPDGRVFRYAKAAAVCDPQGGAYNGTKTFAAAVAPAQSTIQTAIQGRTITAGLVGSSVITMTVAAGGGVAGDGVVAADELRGGTIVYNHGTTQAPQMRQITGNSAVASGGGTCNVYLDAPITTIRIGSTNYTGIVVGTTTIEAMVNPYGYLTGGLTTASDYVTFLGIPAVRATAAQYFWLQTWGPCWITSDGNTCDSARDRTIVFVGNGSVVSSNDVTVESGLQIAGVAMDTSSSGASNAPMVMLQISV
jgi:hypothetical protein